MIDKPSVRHAYVEAEIVTSLAHQIKAIRISRGLTQRELARLLNTTQTAVSRMEDPSYGKLSIKTLFELAKVFDTGLKVQFVSLVQMLQDTWIPDSGSRVVPAFAEESLSVGFVENKDSVRGLYTTTITITVPDLDQQKLLVETMTPAPKLIADKLYIHKPEVTRFDRFVLVGK